MWLSTGFAFCEVVEVSLYYISMHRFVILVFTVLTFLVLEYKKPFLPDRPVLVQMPFTDNITWMVFDPEFMNFFQCPLTVGGL